MTTLTQVANQAATHGQSELKHLDYLDGWRGLAIFFVLISHFYPLPYYNLGRFGVDIFFVLSGLLMSHILFVKRVPLSTFYKRRISRVFPVFFIFISLAYLASYLFNLSAETPNYFYSLFFLRSYLPVMPDLWNTGLPIGHVWSLNVEEHCYIVLSFLTLMPLLKGREAMALFILGFASIFLNFLAWLHPEVSVPNIVIRTEFVASHLLLSAAYALVKHKITHFVPSWLPLLTFILAAACYSNYMPPYAMWGFSPLLLAFTVNHLDKIPFAAKKLLSVDSLRLLGIWSFSIYMWQQPFFFYLRDYENYIPMAVILGFLASILLGIASFYLLENPIRRYLNNHW
jgi:peptidoglycan/LPS O-acetylase OafA/YrhL